MVWQIVIGLETHVQLQTSSKIFSAAEVAFGRDANSSVSPVEFALPGVLPVVNQSAIKHAISLGLAIGATINRASIFARKHYFYPDLPKGYQISQFDQPILSGGSITFIDAHKEKKVVQLTRAHLEEDAGKSLHEQFPTESGIDLNRAGVPLLEIVTEPVMTSAQEASAYARSLHQLVMWLGICDGNLQEGSFRCDANVSVHRPNTPLGTRTELKNINSFRFLEQAIELEAARQIDLLESGQVIIQETRLFDPDKMETRSMRTKEDAHDYRYFPDPDLLPLWVSDDLIQSVQANLPLLPEAARERLINELNLSEYDAQLLTQSKALLDYFDATLSLTDNRYCKTIANFLLGEVSALVNRHQVDFANCPIQAALLAYLVELVETGVLSNKNAKSLLADIWLAPEMARKDLDVLIEQKGLKQVSDNSALLLWVQTTLAASPHLVSEYQAGKDKALNALVGQIMKQSGGSANAQQARELIIEQIRANS